MAHVATHGRRPSTTKRARPEVRRLHRRLGLMRLLCAALAVIGIGLPAIAAADDSGLPMMDPERPVTCAKDKEGKVWRLQCDHAAKVCLYAPDEELDSEGIRR